MFNRRGGMWVSRKAMRLPEKSYKYIIHNLFIGSVYMLTDRTMKLIEKHCERCATYIAYVWIVGYQKIINKKIEYYYDY